MTVWVGLPHPFAEAPPRREAIAYGIYMSTNTFLSAAVVAATLFYVSLLVLPSTN